MQEFEEYLTKQDFVKTDDLESLKVTYKEENDKRYFWDGDILGLHISKAGFNEHKWTELTKRLEERLINLNVLYLARNTFSSFEIESDECPHLTFLNISENKKLEQVRIHAPKLVEIDLSFCENLGLFIRLGVVCSVVKLGVDTIVEPLIARGDELLSWTPNTKISFEQFSYLMGYYGVKFDLNLFDITLFKGEFPCLKKIDISYCSFDNFILPKKLFNLEYCDLSNNKLSHVTISDDLPRLEYLNLENNLLEEVYFKGIFPKLNYLNLSNNTKLQLVAKKISSAKDSLESLHLNDTSINKDALKIFAQFTLLKEVRLNNTPFATQYPEEVQIGWEAIKKLFSSQQIDFLHVKLLLLGNTNIGKSNLLYYWENGGHDIEASKSTHGIVYKEISDLFKTQSGKEIILHIWDFGGQEYFHATHKLFFSGGAINILLWSPENSLREEQEDRCFELEYWLRCIEQLGYDVSGSLKSETLVVENKIDNRNYLATPVNQEKYQKKFGDRIDFHYHSMALMPEGKSTNQPRRLTGLNDLLFERIQNKNFSRDISYENTYNRIKNLKEPIIEVKKLFSANPTEEEITLLRVFHNMGILLYFHEILPDLVFIKPASFLQFLYTDLFGKDKSHKITEAGIKKALEASSFNTLLTQEKLIDILKSFDLIFKINENQTTFFIPQYLPPKPIWLDFFEEHHFRFPTVLIESDSYLMNLVMLKIFGEYGKSVKREGNEYLFWNDGIVIEQELKGKKNILLIKFDRENQRIELYEDEENFDLLKSVIDFVVSIPEKSKRSLKDNSVASTNDEIETSVLNESNKRTHSPWETPYFDIRLTTDGQYYVYYRELVEAKKALNNYVRSFDKTKIEEFYKPILVYRFNKYLPKNQQSEMKKLMISYSKKDLYLIEEFKKYLEPLIRDGIIDEPWYCTMLEAGQEWDSEIQDRLKNWCDIICFMCSPNSFSADYIKEKEIKVAIDRFELKNDIMIVPIILEPFRWISNNEKYNLGRFTALPYTAKPVTDFKQRNMAWYIIEECLRVAILNNLKPEGEDYWADTEKAKLPKDVISYFERIVRGGLDI